MRNNEMIKRLQYTLLIFLLYGCTWIALELFIEGALRDNLVDNIMLLLFTPVAWLASEHFQVTKNNSGVKPIITHKEITKENDLIEVEWTCPVCDANVIEEAPCSNYCQSCGHKLIWDFETRRLFKKK